MRSRGTKSAAQIFIRGMGQTDYLPVTDPGVAIYVDGIYMARSVGAVMELLDVERVEVLRGPQGTLFGRNAMGGAVSLHSRRPGEIPRRSVRATFGNDRMTNVTAVMSGRLAGRLSAGATVSHRHRDGYVKRIHDGLDMGDDNAQATRVSLVWRPRDGAELFATADYTRQRENGAPTVSGGVNDLMAFGTFGNALLDECTAVRINPDFPGDGPPSFPPPGKRRRRSRRLLRAGQLRRGIPRRGELSRFRRSRFMGRKRRTDLDIGRVGHPEIAHGLSGDAVVGVPRRRQHSREHPCPPRSCSTTRNSARNSSLAGSPAEGGCTGRPASTSSGNPGISGPMSSCRPGPSAAGATTTTPPLPASHRLRVT